MWSQGGGVHLVASGVALSAGTALRGRTGTFVECWLPSWTVSARFAAIAIGVGIAIAFTGMPTTGSFAAVTCDTSETMTGSPHAWAGIGTQKGAGIGACV